jgi:hypothetical protein
VCKQGRRHRPRGGGHSRARALPFVDLGLAVASASRGSDARERVLASVRDRVFADAITKPPSGSTKQFSANADRAARACNTSAAMISELRGAQRSHPGVMPRLGRNRRR